MSARYQKWLPIIDGNLCTGCGRCLEVCGSRALQLINGGVVLARALNCTSDDQCVSVCEEDALRMDWIDLAGDKNRGRWRAEVDIVEILKNRQKRHAQS